MSCAAVYAGWRRPCRALGINRMSLGPKSWRKLDARVTRMLAPVPDPDTPDWRPKHHAVPTEAAALHRRRWAPSAGAEPGHDLLADPDAMVEVARILRAAEVG